MSLNRARKRQSMRYRTVGQKSEINRDEFLTYAARETHLMSIALRKRKRIRTLQGSICVTLQHKRQIISDGNQECRASGKELTEKGHRDTFWGTKINLHLWTER